MIASERRGVKLYERTPMVTSLAGARTLTVDELVATQSASAEARPSIVSGSDNMNTTQQEGPITLQTSGTGGASYGDSMCVTSLTPPPLHPPPPPTPRPSTHPPQHEQHPAGGTHNLAGQWDGWRLIRRLQMRYLPSLSLFAGKTYSCTASVN